MAILDEPIKDVLKLENFINGEWVGSKSDQSIDVINPATRKTIAKAPVSTTEEVESAIAAAKEAWPEWRQTPPLARVRCLFRLKELLENNFEELSRVQTMEHGKTIDESRGETRRGIEMVEVASGIPSLMQGFNLEDIAAGIDEYAIYQPLGVFTHIAPYNFPFMVPLWFSPFAMATGNTFVVKPSPRDPISQVKLAELIEEAGIPARGVQPGARPCGRGQCADDPPGRPGGDLCRLDHGGPRDLQDRGGALQTVGGADERQELHGGHARRGY